MCVIFQFLNVQPDAGRCQRERCQKLTQFKLLTFVQLSQPSPHPLADYFPWAAAEVARSLHALFSIFRFIVIVIIPRVFSLQLQLPNGTIWLYVRTVPALLWSFAGVGGCQSAAGGGLNAGTRRRCRLLLWANDQAWPNGSPKFQVALRLVALSPKMTPARAWNPNGETRHRWT